MTQRCRVSASCQAVLTATVVAPTPPRTPSTKTSLPVRVGCGATAPVSTTLQARVTRSATSGLKKYSATPTALRLR